MKRWQSWLRTCLYKENRSCVRRQLLRALRDGALFKLHSGLWSRNNQDPEREVHLETCDQ